MASRRAAGGHAVGVSNDAPAAERRESPELQLMRSHAAELSGRLEGFATKLDRVVDAVVARGEHIDQLTLEVRGVRGDVAAVMDELRRLRADLAPFLGAVAPAPAPAPPAGGA